MQKHFKKISVLFVLALVLGTASFQILHPSTVDATYIPIPTGASYVVKCASVANFDITTTLASTSIPYSGSFTGANTYPLFAAVKYNSGTMGAAVVSVNHGGIAIAPGNAVSSLSPTKKNVSSFIRPFLYDTTSTFSAVATTGSVSIGSVDIDVYCTSI